jgi:membrane protein YqaA with SNARE-associated domain
MLRRLYDWTLAQADRPNAVRIFAVICFIESSFFPIPSEVMMLPMCLKRPDRALYYAFIASVFSVLGGIFGWMIGYFAYETVGRTLLAWFGGLDAFEALRQGAGAETMTVMMITSSLAHLPPIKIVTILSGALGVNLGLFVLIAAVVRTARFFLIGWLLMRYGEPIRTFIERRLGWIAAGVAALLVALWLILKALHT